MAYLINVSLSNTGYTRPFVIQERCVLRSDNLISQIIKIFFLVPNFMDREKWILIKQSVLLYVKYPVLLTLIERIHRVFEGRAIKLKQWINGVRLWRSVLHPPYL